MGLVLNPRIVWVNPIDKLSVAEHKLYQLQVADRLGLQVPRTLVSDDVEGLREFASGNATGTVCKPIFHGMFFDGFSQNAIYTRRLDVNSLDAESLRVCPILVSRRDPRVADVRATFIGRHCFVADIRGDASLIDWRDLGAAVDYSVSTLDDTTVGLCRQMLAEFGLVYGAFDFIRMPSGNLVFLEVNPTGEWAWLEDKLKFPMRDAFIEVYLRRPELSSGFVAQRIRPRWRPLYLSRSYLLSMGSSANLFGSCSNHLFLTRRDPENRSENCQ